MTIKSIDLLQDPIKAAELANLRYVSDEQSGYRRIRWGKGFSYRDDNNKLITSEKLKKRFKLLVIPPMWQDVWICKFVEGHIQATGRDAKNRKQYLYHQAWQLLREQAKFDSLIHFAENLPKLRAQLNKDLKEPILCKEHITAAVVYLLEHSLIRIGNDSYAQKNKTYGLTTMRNKHLTVKGKTIEFDFIGKSGKEQKVSLKDKKLAKTLKACSELPGYRVFQYVDDEGVKQSIDSADVNEYLKLYMGNVFSAKDFRTWVASVRTMTLLSELHDDIETRKKREAELRKVIKQVAQELGNTVTVCKKSYIHPLVQENFLDNVLRTKIKKSKKTYKSSYLSKDEKVFLNFLASNTKS